MYWVSCCVISIDHKYKFRYDKYYIQFLYIFCSFSSNYILSDLQVLNQTQSIFLEKITYLLRHAEIACLTQIVNVNFWNVGSVMYWRKLFESYLVKY